MAKLQVSMDWLSITFPVAGMDAEHIMHAACMAVGTRMPMLSKREVEEDFGEWISTTLQAEELGRGFNGFTDSASLIYFHDDKQIRLGTVAWGGKSQKDRAYIVLTGIGAQMLNPLKLESMLDELDGRITRIDTAVDDFQGQFPIEKAVHAYRKGAFNSGGRPPAAKFIDDLGNKTGKTLYVGKRESGKMLRAYQKGLQLNPGSNDKWIRYEVELHNTDRDIPKDIGAKLVEHFLGAYYYLAMTFSKPLQARSEKISCNRIASKLISLRFWDQFKRQNGRFLNLIYQLNIKPHGFISELTRVGLPKKLQGRLTPDLIEELKLPFVVLPV